MRKVTINGGADMCAWYDIAPRAPLAGTHDIRRSAEQIDELVQAEEGRGTARQGGVIS